MQTEGNSAVLSQNGGDLTVQRDSRSGRIPIAAGAAFTEDAWRELRLRTIFECCKWDVQSHDHCVLANYPLFVDPGDWATISGFAELLSEETLAAEREISVRPELHDALGLPTPIVRAMRNCTERDVPREGARVMRFDFHLTPEGWRISEVNADVPGGFVEASGFTRLVAERISGMRACGDPAGEYARALARLAGNDGIVALVHATWHADDRQVMEYLSMRLQESGASAALCGPSEIAWRNGEATFPDDVNGRRKLVLARFFPAEWLPTLEKRLDWEPWFRGSSSKLSNPGTALFVQTKRFPLIWSSLSTRVEHWRNLLPETRAVRDMEGADWDWVIKPALGRVGENVLLEGVTPQKLYRNILHKARRNSRNWVAQRRFETVAISTPDGWRYPCIGVFTLDGRTIGAYGRVAKTPIINEHAQDVAVLLDDARSVDEQ